MDIPTWVTVSADEMYQNMFSGLQKLKDNGFAVNELYLQQLLRTDEGFISKNFRYKGVELSGFFCGKQNYYVSLYVNEGINFVIIIVNGGINLLLCKKYGEVLGSFFCGSENASYCPYIEGKEEYYPFSIDKVIKLEKEFLKVFGSLCEV